MHYICLVYVDESTFDGFTAEDHRKLAQESLAYDEDLQARGHFIAADALQPPAEAITVRVRNGKMATTDGPYAETKEHLGGFILIEARDMNEAVQIASKIPMARHGGIEVRPAMDIG